MPPVDYAPEPPVVFPPARTVHVEGRGEFFLRDSGLFDSDPNSHPSNHDRPVVLLLHGWIATADMNWSGVYGSLVDAGYRVLAIDHRGHGRGLRPLVPFRLADCAADAAGVLRKLELAPALIVGYSMGGAIAQLVARDHPDVVAGLILSGTAQHWQEPQLKFRWRLLEIGGIAMRLAPNAFWGFGLKQVGMKPGPQTSWLRGEILRHNTTDILEAGRELRRYDSRPWLAAQRFPTAVVVTTRDSVVGPRKQRELAAALEAPVFEAAIDHLEVAYSPEAYDKPLINALDHVRSASAAAAR